jgi:DNA-binding IclR family transcriptional regulator
MPRQARSALVALDILELLQAKASEPIGVSDVSRHIGINKATSHTVLRMLESRGYAVQDPDSKKFRRGPSLWNLGVALVGTANPVELAKAELATVCAATNANASLSRHAGNGTMHVVLHVGGAFDVHRMYRSETRVAFPSGVAAVVLAWEAPQVAREVYAAWKPERRPQGALSSFARYAKLLGEIRRGGFHTGISATPFPDVAICFTEAPVFDADGRVVFVVSVTTLTGARDPVLRYYPKEALRVASTLTRSIGGHAPVANAA